MVESENLSADIEQPGAVVYYGDCGKSDHSSIACSNSDFILCQHAVNDIELAHFRDGLVAEVSELNVIDCVLTENEVAITARDTGVVRLSAVSVINNRTGLLNVGGKIFAFNHVLIHGNQTDGSPSIT